MPVTITVTAKGPTADDLAMSLEVVTKQLSEGFTSGFDRNGDTGDSYSFSVDGEEDDT